MGLETATYITDLVSNNPLGTDSKAQGDNHIRLLKSVLKAQFPNLGSAAATATAAELNKLDGATATTAELNILSGVTATAAELNKLDGCTSSTAELNLLTGVSSIYDLVYPVGALFETTTSANPSTYFTGTTWVAYGTGRVTVGYNAADSDFDNINDTGGAKTVALSIAEMPSHTHTDSLPLYTNRSSSSGPRIEGTSSNDIEANWSVTTNSTGGGSAHENMPPYCIVYRWKRTA